MTTIEQAALEAAYQSHWMIYFMNALLKLTPERVAQMSNAERDRLLEIAGDHMRILADKIAMLKRHRFHVEPTGSVQ